jgi:hypothetical protein
MADLDCCDLSIGVEVRCHDLRKIVAQRAEQRHARHGSSNARRIRTSAMASRPPCRPLELAGGPGATCPFARHQLPGIPAKPGRGVYPAAVPARLATPSATLGVLRRARRRETEAATPRMGQRAGRNDARRVQQAVGTDASSRRGLARWREPGWVLCVALPLPEQPS